MKERGARTQPWVCLTPRGQKDSDSNDDTGHQLMSPEPGTEPGIWHFLSSYSLLTRKGESASRSGWRGRWNHPGAEGWIKDENYNWVRADPEVGTQSEQAREGTGSG